MGVVTRTCPARPFNRDRWTHVDADVQIKAQTILRPQALPLERLMTRLRMREVGLTLDRWISGPLAAAVARTITLDGQQGAHSRACEACRPQAAPCEAPADGAAH